MDMINLNFWRGKKVFLTGHTGFKGSWLSLWLQQMGAEVTGYALPPNTTPNLFELADIQSGMKSHFGDILDKVTLSKIMADSEAEIIFHLAAQPLVRLSYQEPELTFATNVMGTLNVLEAARAQKSLKAMIVITTDKCYENNEWMWGYRETEKLGGKDPYSASKACTEILTAAYRYSFFKEQAVGLATVRAGNVIGGGDWAADRLIPDILNAIDANKNIQLRNPKATRPWQHVLEPLSGYLLLAEKLFEDTPKFSSAWNFGPSLNDVRPVEDIVSILATALGKNLSSEKMAGNHPHEAHFLALDSTKAQTELGWRPHWNLETALNHIAEWHKAYHQKQNMRAITLNQIKNYCETLLSK